MQAHMHVWRMRAARAHTHTHTHTHTQLPNIRNVIGKIYNTQSHVYETLQLDDKYFIRVYHWVLVECCIRDLCT